MTTVNRARPAVSPRLRASFRIGVLRVDALSDGIYPKGGIGDYFTGASDAEWMRAVGVTDPHAELPSNIGCFLVRGDGRTVLIDTGWGGRSLPPRAVGWGELLSRLQEVGARAEDIDLVIHTHLHGDHICGDVTEPNRQRQFPNARVLVSEVDLGFWLDPLNTTQRALVAREVMTPLLESGVVDTFQGEHAVSQSLTMLPTPGHTPGHCSVLVTSQDERLIITGDAVLHPAHFEHMDWVMLRDIDRELSMRSRADLAGIAADRNALVTGGHFAPVLTIGRVRRVPGGFRWESASPFYLDIDA
jgi:glyoxylase-like metal-dependent hydrolase (beta-lactamase superfamily II)